jgi:uncharacterized Zn-finger protein
MPTPGQSGKKDDSLTDARGYYRVGRADLPLHCPMPGTSLWDSHPRVFLPIEEAGEAVCPYCGARYVLVDAH